MASRSSGRPAARGYEDVGTIAARSGVPDERRRLVARVAHTEVDQGAAGVQRFALAPVELLERIRLHVPHPG